MTPSLHAHSENDFGRLRQAVRLARTFHRGQVRKGPWGEPYYLHPRRVCKAYLRFHHKTLDGAIASLCHDLVEDTPVTHEDIARIFGNQVHHLVDHLTKPPTLPSALYARSIPRWRLESKKIKLCDIEDNIAGSNELDPESRRRMLGKWKRYLQHLQVSRHKSSPERQEYHRKWSSVYSRCTLELEKMKLAPPDAIPFRSSPPISGKKNET